MDTIIKKVFKDEMMLHWCYSALMVVKVITSVHREEEAMNKLDSFISVSIFHTIWYEVIKHG